MSVDFLFNDTATTEIYTLSLTTLFRSGKREKDREGIILPGIVTVFRNCHTVAYNGGEEHMSNRCVKGPSVDSSEVTPVDVLDIFYERESQGGNRTI